MMLLANFDIKKSGLISALLLLVASGLLAEKPAQDNFLFQVLRSRDADRIYYEVQIDSLGHLDAKNPVNAYLGQVFQAATNRASDRHSKAIWLWTYFFAN
jgi:hypothetical protein